MNHAASIRAYLLAFVLAAASPVAAQPVEWLPTSGPRGGNAEVVVSAAGTLLLRVPTGWLRSTDGGESWTEVERSLSSIWSATGGGLWAGGSDGVHYSGDDGRTWQQIGLADRVVRTVRVQEDGTIWAWADSLLRSPDGGATWIGSMGGLEDLCPPALLAIVDESIYVGSTGCGGFGFGSSLARWDSSAARWIVEESDAGFGGNFSSILRGSAGAFWATSADVYTYSDGGLFRSADTPWERVASGPHFGLVESPDGQLFVGRPRGLLRSRDNGQTWQEWGLAGFPVRSQAFTSGGIHYVGTSTYCYPAYDPPVECVPGFGAYVLHPGESTWVPLEPDRPTAQVVSLVTGSIGVWAATTNGLWLTENRGDEWQPVAVDAAMPWAPDGTIANPFAGAEELLLHETAWGTLFATESLSRGSLPLSAGSAALAAHWAPSVVSVSHDRRAVTAAENAAGGGQLLGLPLSR